MDAKNQMPELDVEELVNRDYRERQRKANETMDERELRSMEAEEARMARQMHKEHMRKRRCETLRVAAAGACYLAAGAGMIWAMTMELVCGGIAIGLAVIWAMKAAVRLQKAKEAWPA